MRAARRSPIPSADGQSLPSPAAHLLEQSSPPRRPESAALYAYLLDLDGELGQELEVRMRFLARQHATVRLLDAESGECELDAWFEAVGEGLGLLITDGLMAVETCVAGRTVTELVGANDLLQPPERNDDDMIDCSFTWRALVPTRLALLDSDFLERVHPWPQIRHALYQRMERRSTDVGLLRAISCQPKLEVRLVLLLWHLAARWGRVEPSGVRLTLPLTHRLLGQLVSAERPSITHALARLAQAGIVTGTPGDWHLHGAADTHLEALTERTGHLPGSGHHASTQPTGAHMQANPATGPSPWTARA